MLGVNDLISKYPWLIEKNSQIVLSPDSDGFLCGLLYTNYLNSEVVGYYDGKVLALKEGVKPETCIYVDLDIFPKAFRSIGHHMVLFNKNMKPNTWHNYDTSIQLNNLRSFDVNKNFQQKYPLGTIHFLLTVFHKLNLIKELPKSARWPLLFCDGLWIVLFSYTENCLEWFKYLDIDKNSNILNPIFCGDESVMDIMRGLDDFLRVRDSFNSTIEFVNGNILEKSRARTGDKMRLSNSKGEVVNLESNPSTGYFDIFSEERTRVIKFIEYLAKGMDFKFLPNSWTWDNLNVTKFEKRDFQGQGLRLNARNFNNLIQDTPFSWAITSSTNVEYTVGRP